LYFLYTYSYCHCQWQPVVVNAVALCKEAFVGLVY